MSADLHGSAADLRARLTWLASGMRREELAALVEHAEALAPNLAALRPAEPSRPNRKTKT